MTQTAHVRPAEPDALDRFLDQAADRGIARYEDAIAALAEVGPDERRIARLLRRLDNAGVPLVEGEDDKPARTEPRIKKKLHANDAEPIQTYLDWMGSVTLLTREGEVELARTIPVTWFAHLGTNADTTTDTLVDSMRTEFTRALGEGPVSVPG